MAGWVEDSFCRSACAQGSTSSSGTDANGSLGVIGSGGDFGFESRFGKSRSCYRIMTVNCRNLDCLRTPSVYDDIG